MKTNAIPTDKYGHIYYGPKTVAEAQRQIDDGRPVAEAIALVREAGYEGVARRLVAIYGTQKS